MCGEGGQAWQGGMHGEGVCVVKLACMAKGGCSKGRGMCGIRRDTINERAVRILLECILVDKCTEPLATYRFPCSHGLV